MPQSSYHELSSEDISLESSANPSRPSSSGGNPPPKRGRVRFNSTSEANDLTNKRSSVPLRDDGSLSPQALTFPKQVKISPAHSRNGSASNLLRRMPDQEVENPFSDLFINAAKKRPSLVRNNSSNGSLTQESNDYEEFSEKTFSALAAQERAQRVASLVGSHSAPASRRTSLEDLDEEHSLHGPGSRGLFPVRVDDIPLMPIDRATFDSDDEDLEKGNRKNKVSSTKEAHKLVRAHTQKHRSDAWRMSASSTPGVSGQVTPTEEQQLAEEYVPRPQQYRGGVLSSLLKLYNAPQGPASRRGSDTSAGSPSHTVGSSGTATPRTKAAKWYNHKSQSQDTLAGLIEASAILGAQGGIRTPKKGPSRPSPGKRGHSGKLLESAMGRISGRPRLEDEIRITVHIAETLSRQKYLLKLCRALMSYGAPTHRLEEYMKMSARVLEIDGQFLYIPGCMIISFDDVTTHTTEVKLVRTNQGVDLGKLKDIHEIYKEVVHDVIGVEEATQRLDIIINAQQMYPPWVLVIVHGFASATVAPFGMFSSPQSKSATSNTE
jgi:hypothetical protein